MGDSENRRRPPLRCDRSKVERDSYDEHEDRNDFKVIEDKDYKLIEVEMETMFQDVDLSDGESLFESLQKIQYYLEDIAQVGYTRQIIVDIFAKSLKNKNFAVKAGALFGMIHGMKIETESVRSLLLSSIQRELQDNDFSKGNRTQFLNAVFLLSEMYFHIRFDDQPISILGGELINYFRWLLTGDEVEIQVLAVCLIVNGPTLKKDKPASYRKFLIEIRMVLVTRDFHPACRSWLLLVLDMDSVNFNTLHEDLKIFHMSFIGEKGFQRLNRIRPTAKKPANTKSVMMNSHSKVLSSDTQHVTEKWQSVEKHQSPNQQPSRSSPERQSPNTYYFRSSQDRSPDRLDVSERRRSPDSLKHSHESHKTGFKGTRRSSNDYKSSDSMNHLGRPEGRYHNSHSQGNTSQRNSFRGRWSTDGSGQGGNKTERRIQVWEHDDRFDKDYEN